MSPTPIAASISFSTTFTLLSVASPPSEWRREKSVLLCATADLFYELSVGSTSFLNLSVTSTAKNTTVRASVRTRIPLKLYPRYIPSPLGLFDLMALRLAAQVRSGNFSDTFSRFASEEGVSTTWVCEDVSFSDIAVVFPPPSAAPSTVTPTQALSDPPSSPSALNSLSSGSGGQGSASSSFAALGHLSTGLLIGLSLLFILLLLFAAWLARRGFHRLTDDYRRKLNLPPLYDQGEKGSEGVKVEGSARKYPMSPFVTYKSNYPSPALTQYFSRDDIEISKLATQDDLADVNF